MQPTTSKHNGLLSWLALFGSSGTLICCALPIILVTHAKLAATKERIEELERLRNELQLLVNLCRGSADGCPIIDDLEADQRAADGPDDDA